MSYPIRTLFLGLAFWALATPALAQDSARVANPEGLHLTRAQLTEILRRYEDSATSDGYSREMRQRAAETAERIRKRLEEGDFKAGDRIRLEVRLEPDMSGEFAVEPGRTITVPGVGSVGLEGVLRSELQAHLEQELGRYLRSPVVRAWSLIRVAIVGAVGAPGFYTLPATTILEDALMTAGGPQGKADLDRIRIERAGEPVWEAEALQAALIEGRTLDQLSLQAGDRVIVPEQKAKLLSWRSVYTVVLAAGSLAWALTRIF